MSTPIFTITDYKTYTTISSTTMDNQINQLIPIITSFVQKYCGTTFVDYYTSPKVEINQGGLHGILLKEQPVNDIQAMEYSTDGGMTYTLMNEFVDYTYDLDLQLLIPLTDKCWPKRPNGYRVTYTAGYETYPLELKLAAMDLLQYYIRSDMSVKSTRAPGSNNTQIEYILNTNLPAHIKRIFDMHINVY